MRYTGMMLRLSQLSVVITDGLPVTFDDASVNYGTVDTDGGIVYHC